MKNNMARTTLVNIADIKPGHPFRGSINPNNEGDTYAIQIRDINQYGELDEQTLIKTALTGRKKPSYLKEDDILFAIKGAKHFATLIQNMPDNAVCSPHFFVIRINANQSNKVIPAFVSWQLNRVISQQYFKKSAEGSHYVSIRRKVLEDISLVIPPIEKQQQIVAFHNAAIKEQKILHQLINNRQQQVDALAIDLHQSA